MNGLHLVAIMACAAMVGGIIIRTKNEAYTNSEEYEESTKRAEETLKGLLPPEETVLLVDSSESVKETVALTDKGLYQMKDGSVIFQAKYEEIKKRTYRNFASKKVSATGDVIFIELKAPHGNCKLMAFPKAREIARELEQRCEEEERFFI